VTRRGFDWYGLTLPGVLVAGAVSLGVGAAGGGEGFTAAGWILLAVGAVALPFWAIAFVRARTLLGRARHRPGVRFVGSSLEGRRAMFAGFGRLCVVIADDDGVRSLRGRPLVEEWFAPWADIEGIGMGDTRVGRNLAPTIDIETATAGRVGFRVLHENGWQASFKYAQRLLGELRGIRPRTEGRPSSTSRR